MSGPCSVWVNGAWISGVRVRGLVERTLAASKEQLVVVPKGCGMATNG